MDCSTSGFPVLHHLQEFAQTHDHWVNDAIQPSHFLLTLVLLPSIFSKIRVFSSELALCIRWPKYWSFGFSISLSKEYLGLISFKIDWFDLFAIQGTLKSLLQQHWVSHWGAAKLLSKAASPFSVPSSSARGFRSLCSLIVTFSLALWF